MGSTALSATSMPHLTAAATHSVIRWCWSLLEVGSYCVINHTHTVLHSSSADAASDTQYHTLFVLADACLSSDSVAGGLQHIVLLTLFMRPCTGIYIAEDIVLTSLPMSPTNNCFSSGAQDRVAKVGNLLGKKGSRQSATAPKPADSGAQATDKIGAKVASAEPAYKSREPNLHSGLALIYFGPMTVNSRVHDVKIDQGMPGRLPPAHCSCGSAVPPPVLSLLSSAARYGVFRLHAVFQRCNVSRLVHLPCWHASDAVTAAALLATAES